MMKAMLSQPMNGKSDEEIIATRDRAIAALKERGYEVINTLFTDEWYSPEAMKERGVENRPPVFSRKISRKYVSLPCSVFLQGMGNYSRVQN